MLPVKGWAGDTAASPAGINKSHLRAEAQSLGGSKVALPKGIISVALLNRHTGFLSSWGTKYSFGFVFKTLVLKKLRLRLLSRLAENAFVDEHLHLLPPRQGEQCISRPLLFLRC